MCIDSRKGMEVMYAFPYKVRTCALVASMDPHKGIVYGTGLCRHHVHLKTTKRTLYVCSFDVRATLCC